MRWDASTYGRSFAPVYDDWYGRRGDESSVVRVLGELAGDPARVLELGVGTGRLAVPLAAAGWRVWGLDSSPDMLDRLAANAASAGVDVRPILGDAGAGHLELPAVEVVLAAYNFVFNLADRDAQAACFANAARCAHRLVVEAFVPDPDLPAGEREEQLPTGVLVRTVADPSTGVVEGRHRGPDGVERPWRIRVASPGELDELAGAAGWVLTDRRADWHGAAFDPDASPAHVSVYDRARRVVPASG